MAGGRSPRPAGLGAPADRLIANCTFQGPNVGGSFLLPQPSGLVHPECGSVSLHARPGVSVCLCARVCECGSSPPRPPPHRAEGAPELQVPRTGGEVLSPGGAQSSGQAGVSQFSFLQAPRARARSARVPGSTWAGGAASLLSGT